MRTYSPKPGEIERQWHVIDASDVVLGRLATQAATLLRGKHKPVFAPHVDTGDFVIIINAGKVALTGNKRQTKVAYRHSGYPGGLKQVGYDELLEKRPERAQTPRARGRGGVEDEEGERREDTGRSWHMAVKGLGIGEDRCGQAEQLNEQRRQQDFRQQFAVRFEQRQKARERALRLLDALKLRHRRQHQQEPRPALHELLAR